MKYYNLEFSSSIVGKDLRRLTNQVWKLLPMRENNEDWQKQLNSVLIELRGLHRMFGDQLSLLIIISELEGLKDADDFMTYRSAVFGIISMIVETIKSLS